MTCERCFAAPALYHVESDLGPQYLKLDVCVACAVQARKVGVRVERIYVLKKRVDSPSTMG